MSLHYRAMADADLDARHALFRLSFPETVGTDAASTAHYEWKFRTFPSAGGPAAYEYVGADDGTIAAYYAALPYRYRIGGRVLTAGMVCDVMTHPDWRGRGLFTAIGRHATAALADEGIPFTIGYPVRPEVIPGHLKVGWTIVQPLPVWLRPTGTRGVLPRALKPLASIADPLLRLAFAWARPARGYGVELLPRARFLAEVAGTDDYRALLSRWQAATPNALEKDPAFLAWRTAAPGSAYEFAVVRHGGRLVGTALLRATTLRGLDCLALLDVMLDPDHRDGARALHHALAAHARRAGRDGLACMCSREWARAYRFGRSGYLRTPATFSLIVKRLTDAVADAEVYDGARWHAFWIDSDDL